MNKTEKNLNSSQDRIIGIDFLRILCMLFIVIYHVISQGGVSNVKWMTGKYITIWLLQIIVYCAVNCFALISGYVGIKARFHWSRVINLWLQTIFYTIGITLIFSVIMPETVSINSWFEAMFPITMTQYWYISAYFGMFFFIPFMNLIIEKTEKSQMIIFFIMILLFFCCFSLISNQSPYGLLRGYSMVWLSILYIIGGCIRKYEITELITKRRAIAIFLISTIFVWISKLSIEWCSYKIFGKIVIGNIFISYLSPMILINAIALLCFFAKTNFKVSIIKKDYKNTFTCGIRCIYYSCSSAYMEIYNEKLCTIFSEHIIQHK